MTRPEAFDARLATLPEGYFTVSYEGRQYGARLSASPDRRRINLVAEELGGADYISLNFYRLSSGNLLKPCEMPEEKVIDFVLGISDPA